MTHYHSRILADMFQSHLVHDFSLIGPKVRICCYIMLHLMTLHSVKCAS